MTRRGQRRTHVADRVLAMLRRLYMVDPFVTENDCRRRYGDDAVDAALEKEFIQRTGYNNHLFEIAPYGVEFIGVGKLANAANRELRRSMSASARRRSRREHHLVDVP